MTEPESYRIQPWLTLNTTRPPRVSKKAVDFYSSLQHMILKMQVCYISPIAMSQFSSQAPAELNTNQSQLLCGDTRYLLSPCVLCSCLREQNWFSQQHLDGNQSIENQSPAHLVLRTEPGKGKANAQTLRLCPEGEEHACGWQFPSGFLPINKYKYINFFIYISPYLMVLEKSRI